MAQVTIYTKAICPYCVRAKALLDRKGVSYTEIAVDGDDKKRDEMVKLSQRQTVPQIFVDKLHIGGCDDLYALEAKGELNRILGI